MLYPNYFFVSVFVGQVKRISSFRLLKISTYWHFGHFGVEPFAVEPVSIEPFGVEAFGEKPFGGITRVTRDHSP
jgi:hypothetical protein